MQTKSIQHREKQIQKQLHFRFTQTGFLLDNREGEYIEELIPWKERFEADKWGTLYAMGFEEKPKSPYKVEIRISPLTEARCQRAIEKCSRKIENLEQLVNGNFPEELKETFLGERGLFPEPKEISFNCSCPDWALLCKHVAAVLYGIGARVDENPLLFFELRGIVSKCR